jgi:MYXO-CTERM domain-containing protein
VVVDARADGADADIDGLVDAIADAVVRDAVVRDTQVVIDAIVLPDLAPDAQIVDTAIPVVPGPDAAVNTPDTALPNLPAVRVMGAGACAVNPMSNSAPGLFTLFLVAAFGLLVFRRRR